MAGVTCESPLPVREARAGEPDVWDALFKRYQLPLYVYVFDLVRDEQASLDLVQETFVNAARHIERLREDEKFGAWLFGIAHQKCLQHWRKRRPEDPLDETHLEHWAEEDLTPEQWLIRKEQEEEFVNLLEHLPWPQRSVLVLHFLEEFSLEEIAGICGLAESPSKTRPRSTMKTPREILLKRHAPAQTRLDAIREQVVKEQFMPGSAPERADMLESPSEIRPRNELWGELGRQVWRELIWPCRRAWCSLGAVWVAILTLNSLTTEPDPASNRDSLLQVQSLLRFMREQHRLAAELSESFPTSAAAEPSLVPGPRSDRSFPEPNASNVFQGSARASRAVVGALANHNCAIEQAPLSDFPTRPADRRGAGRNTRGACAPLQA